MSCHKILDNFIFTLLGESIFFCNLRERSHKIKHSSQRKMMNFSRTLILLFSFLPFHTVADIVWPEYSQQCRDDAGPPYEDDAEQFGPNGFYHDNHAASPVLIDGNCAKPLQEACNQRPTYKTAYLEGPIDCGNNGWYCRIMPDPDWPAENLIGDLNFGHCNTTEAFEDAGYDQDGHCHGSDVDSTYYWWIRDHFHRGYNGRLRCCCGWYEDTSETPMYGRRIANRCDYRRLVTQSEDLNNCRDANEDHGLGFDDIGCDPNYESSQLNEPIPENDDICWEIQKFGYSEQGNNDNGDQEVDEGFSCFSGDMEVIVQGKGIVRMQDLQVGDFVKIGRGEIYEPVYAFGHRVPQRYAEFVQLHTNVDKRPLEMTGEHLVFLEGKTNPVRADSIKAGDLLRGQDSNAVVQKIKFVHRNGIYNPLTSSGTILVNGVTASTYVSFQKSNNEYVELQGGIEIPISHHDLAHLAMAPFRFYCTVVAICDSNDANSGMPVYVSKAMDLVEWRKQQHITVQLFVWASILLSILASILMACTLVVTVAASLISCSKR